MSTSFAEEDFCESNRRTDVPSELQPPDEYVHRRRWRDRPGRGTATRDGFGNSVDAGEPDRVRSRELPSYMRYAAHSRLLTRAEELQLAERALNSDEQARHRLVLSNLRLVIKFAKRYKDRGIDFEDIVQEGNLGLLRASQSYDPSKGTRFSTYACMWIIQFISRMIDNKARSIRLPIRVHKDIRVVKQIIEQVRTSRGTEPSVEEIMKYSKLSEARVEAAFKNMISPISLNQESGFEHTSELGDQIVYDDVVCVESPVEHQLSQALVATLLKILTPDEYVVVSLRYGLTGDREIGFKEISERTGISIGKVKRMHSIALKKMKRKADLLSQIDGRDVKRRGDFTLPG